MDKLERKYIPQFTKAIEGRTVTGIASVFGNIDSYGDIMHPGSFTKTIKEGMRRVRHLWQHDTFAPPIAAIKGMREVGMEELPEQVRDEFPDAIGGLEVSREYLNTERGNEVLEGIRSGAINEMSFGFNPVKEDFEDVDGRAVRNIREVRLWDTSDVNWGANPATAASKSPLDQKLLLIKQHVSGSLADLQGIENVYGYLAAMPVDIKQLAGELESLLRLLKAEPPSALTFEYLEQRFRLLQASEV